MALHRVDLFGYSFIAEPELDTVAEAIYTETMSGHKDLLVVTPNAYTLQVQYRAPYRDIQAYTRQADFVLPDGMPIVWLSRMKHKDPVRSRLTGADLFPLVWNQIRTHHTRATLVLPDQQAAEALLQDHPGACNTLVPAFFDAADDAYITKIAKEIVQLLDDNRSRFLFIGLGDPKQILISRKVQELRQQKMPATKVTTLLLGASFQFYLGTAQRAPAFFRKSGLEWFYRLCKEPRRLWRRYTVDNLHFLYRAFRELAGKSS